MLYVKGGCHAVICWEFFLEYVNDSRKTHKVLLSKQNVYNKYIM